MQEGCRQRFLSLPSQCRQHPPQQMALVAFLRWWVAVALVALVAALALVALLAAWQLLAEAEVASAFSGAWLWGFQTRRRTIWRRSYNIVGT